jgi:hypothetical protein
MCIGSDADRFQAIRSRDDRQHKDHEDITQGVTSVDMTARIVELLKESHNRNDILGRQFGSSGKQPSY